MMKLRLVLVAALAALGPVGCDPFDPDLGDEPFRCGSSTPRCPSGYREVNVSQVMCVCERGTGEPAVENTTASDGGFRCNDESRRTGDPGANDTPLSATNTAIGSGTSTAAYSKLAICPESDVDHFALNVTQAGMTIEARVQPEASQPGDGRGNLQVSILNPSMIEVATSKDQGGLLLATHVATSTGKYFVKVRSASGGQNNYDIQLLVSK
ncbi:MAG: hypothetical protein HY698_10535 [Deltaproteobacteria bacterium]|nr:hypothetical protein [Deltaproteobacteria bacterium]